MSVESIKRAMSRTAAPMKNAPDNNEAQSTVGMADVFKPPTDRAPGTLDAHWGDHPAEGHNGYPDVYGTAAMQAAKDGREEMLERLFDSPKTTAPAEQAFMSQHFVNASKGDPHAPMLQRGRLPAKTASVDDETLTDAVVRIAGRR
jgi:hypothetical protein